MDTNGDHRPPHGWMVLRRALNEAVSTDRFDHAFAIWAVTFLFVLAVALGEVDVVPSCGCWTAVFVGPGRDG